MCELFALSSKYPTNVRISFDELRRHGGGTGPHGDGWGVAHFDGRDVQVLREPGPAVSSTLAAYVRNADMRSSLVVSHIRRATKGTITLANTHPFARELGGRMHVFAHNGHLSSLPDPEHRLGRFQPVGSTDSERAFCRLLSMLGPAWHEGTPSPHQRFAIVGRFAEILREHGVANFLYADGELLFAHGHRRPQIHDDDPIVPGLYVLHRDCEVDLDAETGVTIAACKDPQEVVIAATVPLSDEGWVALSAEGELVMARAGRQLAR